MWAGDMQAVWYRHWLELRTTFRIVCVLTLLAALGYAFAVHGAEGYFARSGRLTSEIARYDAILQMSRGPQLIPWAVHTLVVGFFAIWIPSLFMGTGLGVLSATRSALHRHVSLYFTASLPVSREWLIGSRVAAGVASVCGVLIVSLAAHVVALLLIGQPIPLIAMIKTTLLGVVVGLALIAVGASLSLIVSESVGGFVAFVITIALWLTQDGWNGTLEFLADRSRLAPSVVIASSVLLVVSSIAVVRRKDL